MQEIDVPGPIPGVSTGKVAIVGPALSGPINTPVFVTNWTQFTEAFGGYSYEPPIHATHAVRGFFENGGSVCCFVRVGKARKASLMIPDRSGGAGHPVLALTAREEGAHGNNISAAVSDAMLCDTKAAKCSADAKELSANRLRATMSSEDDAKLFAAGDAVSVTQGTVTENAEVSMVAGAVITLKTALIGKFTDDPAKPVTVRLADPKGRKRLRLLSAEGLFPGSYLQISQSDAAGDVTEFALIEGVDENSVLLRSSLINAFRLSDGSADIVVRSLEFTLTVKRGAEEEVYKELSTVPYHPNYYEKVLKEKPAPMVVVSPADPPNPSQPPENLPDPSFSGVLSGGVNDSIGGLIAADYEDAIASLDKVSVNIVCVPDAVKFGPGKDNTVPKALLRHCQNMGDRFAILDCAYNLKYDLAIEQRNDCFGVSTYGAAYYPWIEIPHPLGQGRLKVPPSGHIAGVYARTDDQKGVHKAPGNEVIMGCLGPDISINAAEHGMLNEMGVNAIVNVPGGGPTIMGARTLSNPSTGTQWRYINVRRLLLYIENSILEATRFAVFLPNNPSLWATVKRQVSDFLTGVWRDGALFGATPAQAFKVKVDEELNPPSVRALGQLIIEIVLYPVTPAEFVIFRVIQQPGGPSVSE